MALELALENTACHPDVNLSSKNEGAVLIHSVVSHSATQ